MLLNDEVQMLKRVPLFAGVSPAKLKLLAFTSDRVNFAAGEVLFRQGETGDAAYVILSGKAEILVETSGGEFKLADVELNSIVGEIAILCDVTRTATIRAVTPLDALRIRKEHFLKLLTDFPEMTIEVMRVLADRLSRTTTELIKQRDLAHHA
ncbi:cyclic nucleotide-binding domain-containing protein [Rhizobium sp. TRM95111]|uniref:cyclic nucleotide-binding domain-containing protein n=1 Tax=Rhizobium alarense TaxID=2846851 RepID=UPI001F238DBE|nr:cyclic nucleotide-binding domain-containing protein [Rhizobium alarense]MCF3642658.1 cyclic nucleotide-binding domain-containing protein [Rhizobium alarense]